MFSVLKLQSQRVLRAVVALRRTRWTAVDCVGVCGETLSFQLKVDQGDGPPSEK